MRVRVVLFTAERVQTNFHLTKNGKGVFAHSNRRLTLPRLHLQAQELIKVPTTFSHMSVI